MSEPRLDYDRELTNSWMIRALAAEQEIERLRDVIRDVADPKRNKLAWEDWGNWVQNRARAALAPQPERNPA